LVRLDVPIVLFEVAPQFIDRGKALAMCVLKRKVSIPLNTHRDHAHTQNIMASNKINYVTRNASAA
jgi:hypothetical protein